MCEAPLSTPAPKQPRYCPFYKTAYGYNPLTHFRRLVPLRCKKWNCDFCRSRNVYLLQERALAGHPQRLLTLTTRSRPGETPKDCHDRCRPQIARLMTAARKKYGNIEYAVFLERTKAGQPHWHILLRGAYIPQAWISDTWKKLTGAYVVDIRKLTSGKGAAKYVVKYVTKEASYLPAERLGRLVSFSKRYLPPREKANFLGFVWEILRDTDIEVLRSGLRARFEETETLNGWVYSNRPPSSPISLLDQIDLLFEPLPPLPIGPPGLLHWPADDSTGPLHPLQFPILDRSTEQPATSPVTVDA